MSGHPLYGNVSDYLNCIYATDDYEELLFIMKEICLDWDEGYLSAIQAKSLMDKIIKILTEMRYNNEGNN